MSKLKLVERTPKSWCVHTLADNHVGALLYEGGRDFVVVLHQQDSNPDITEKFESLNVDEALAYVEALAIEHGVIRENTGKSGFLPEIDLGAFTQTQIANVYLLAKTLSFEEAFFKHAAQELGACLAHHAQDDPTVEGLAAVRLFLDLFREAFKKARDELRADKARKESGNKNDVVAMIMEKMAEAVEGKTGSAPRDRSAAGKPPEVEVKVVAMSGKELAQLLASGTTVDEDDDEEEPTKEGDKAKSAKVKAATGPVRH